MGLGRRELICMIYFVNCEKQQCQLGKPEWQKEGWDATRYFFFLAPYYEILRQFVGVLEETEKSMLSKDTPQQESDEKKNARKAECLYNVAQEEKAEWELKQGEDGEKFLEELEERDTKRPHVR